jgi:hypothetical protein
MALPYDDDYLAVNTGAHRKPAPALDTPSVIQHFAFWQPQIKKEEWHEAIDYFLFRIFMRLRHLAAHECRTTGENRFRCPNLDQRESRLYLCRHNIRVDPNDEYDDRAFRPLTSTEDSDRSIRYEVFSIYTQLLGVDLTVRAELRNEFWTLTFVGDFSSLSPRSTNGGAHTKIVNAFNDLGALFSARIVANRSLDLVEPITPDEETKLYHMGDSLYDSLPDLVSKEIIEECAAGFPPHIKFANIGGLFADFRGAVIGIIVNSCRTYGNCLQKNEDGGDPYRFSYMEPLRSQTNLRRTIHSHANDLPYGKDNVGPRIVDALWPAVKEFYSPAEPANVVLQKLSKPEFTVTFFQASHSIYMSSLGRFTNQPLSQRKEPLRYTIVCSYSNRWELGRLVERINNMGTLRLAAIHNVAKLQDASDRLRGLYDLWQTNSHASDFDAKKLAIDIEKLGSNIDAGLTYRIERSAYYVKSFDTILRGLREKRLEGFQPYRSFVQRRMGGTFDFIARIGIRYRELRSEVELTLERQRTEKITRLHEAAVSLNLKTEKIQESIDVTIHNLDKSQHDTNNLLLRAEWLVGITLTYYIGTIGFELLTDVFPHLGLWKYLAYFATAVIVTSALWLLHPHGRGARSHAVPRANRDDVT